MAESKLKLAFLVVGVWFSWTLFGWAMERVTSTKFGEDGSRFSYTWTVVLIQSIGNASTAAVVLLTTGKRNFTGDVPARDWIIAGAAFMGAANFGLVSLHYIIFPMQVLVKSCKAIPVMFGEVIFERHVKLTTAKIISVMLLCAGVVTFTFGKKGSKEETLEFDHKLMIGLVFVMLALLCDGIYGPYQNRIKTKASERGAPISAYHNMFNMNFWQGVMALFVCLVTGELPEVAAFVSTHPSIVKIVAEYAAAMAFGQVFIFQLQASFGALLVTKTTTVRKLISVLVSVWYFGHSLNAVQWGGAAMVFLSEPAGKMLGDFCKAREVAVAPQCAQDIEAELTSSFRARGSCEAK